eukprot:TRINITY_DN3238_c0_g1_i1.p1 TRINITY_DN3238_c0_g1~~TRINITY_DN3238_c0_g1_i1.p1  ORF type:complete len:277 (-),score=16.78 TRINITY_DN3238_c0_g1_i1:41-871(-)
MVELQTLSGFYTQWGTFQHTSMDISQSSTGRITGGGTDSVGQFTVEGRISPTSITIVKRYPTHKVHYDGKTSNSSSYCGQWRVGKNTGTFVLQKCKQHDETACKWEGEWTQTQTEAMQLVVQVENSSLSGVGADKLGLFTIAGTLTTNLYFVKEYVGGHAVVYKGITQDGKLFHGEWTVDGARGPFKLQAPSVVVHAESQVDKQGALPDAAEASCNTGLANIDSDNNKCKICWENKSDSVLLPCGHVAFCMGCAKKLKSCPLCRSGINNVTKVYIS